MALPNLAITNFPRKDLFIPSLATSLIPQTPLSALLYHWRTDHLHPLQGVVESKTSARFGRLHFYLAVQFLP